MGNYTVHSDWKDDLIWCPSQCYKNIEYKGRRFVIYLRWRWEDPWTADIVECDEQGGFKREEWHLLSVSYWKDTQLKQLKKEAEKLAKRWLIENVE